MQWAFAEMQTTCQLALQHGDNAGLRLRNGVHHRRLRRSLPQLACTRCHVTSKGMHFLLAAQDKVRCCCLQWASGLQRNFLMQKLASCARKACAQHGSAVD